MFTGLSAFPLTPLNETNIDETKFIQLIQRLVSAGVDSLGVLGSTGSYAYLTRHERQHIAQLAIQHAGDIPVIIGIGALRTRDVLDLAQDAQKAGAQGVLLAPISYQKLSDDEVFNLFDTVTRALSVPLCVYDNPGTTHFTFSDELHGRIAKLPNVASIKIPSVSTDPGTARTRVERLRSLIPAHVTIGVSGDASAVNGLNAGCEAWYSVIGGLFPQATLAIMRSAQAGNAQEASRLSAQLAPIWKLFDQYGSLRVIATAAELCGLVTEPCLPLPIQTLQNKDRRELDVMLDTLSLA